MLNHIQQNHSLVTKNGLYLSLKDYCSSAGMELSTIVPQTFYLSSACGDEDRHAELETFISLNKDTVGDIIWILKPAFAANQGFGIKVVSGLDECLAVTGCQENSCQIQRDQSIEEAEEKIELEGAGQQDCAAVMTKKNRAPRTTEWIVQRYMMQPLLVHGRKFDIRCFVLVVMKQVSSRKRCGDGTEEGCDMKCYLYKDGYVRTSGKKYNLNDLSDKETHLTNDAVQKKAANYGKYESGNKLTYDQFQESIDKDYRSAPPQVVRSKILPQIEHQVKGKCYLTRL